MDTYSAPPQPAVPFPTQGGLNLHGSPSRALYLTSGSSDSLQDLYPLQQYQGVIHRRSSSLRNLQMSWSRTLFLRAFWQLGVVFTNSGLLAPPFRAPSITWTESFPTLFPSTQISPSETPDLTTKIRKLAKQLSDTFDGCYGIWGNQWNLDDDWSHVLPRRDPDTSNGREFPFWVKWAHFVH